MAPTADATLTMTVAGQAYDLAGVPLPLVTCEADGTVRSLSAAASSLLGHGIPPGPDGLVGLLTAAGVGDADGCVRRARTAPQTIWLRRGGRDIRVSLTCAAAADGSEAFTIVPTACDAQGDAQRAEFQSLVAHDLRSPLAVIQGYAGLLSTGLSGPLNANQREFVAGIDLKVDELVRLLDDFLDYQRLDAGALVLDLEPVVLAELMDQVVEEYRGRATARGLSLSCELPPRRVEVQADPLRLRQILDNLVSNAVKYAAAGTWIRVSGRGAGSEVELVVADGGPGLPADELAALFRPYERSSLAHRSLGAGLGLLVVQRLVAQHGGRIDAHSPPDAGLRFVVSLPRQASSLLTAG